MGHRQRAQVGFWADMDNDNGCVSIFVQYALSSAAAMDRASSPGQETSGLSWI